MIGSLRFGSRYAYWFCKLFGTRAAAEMQRLRAEAALREWEKQNTIRALETCEWRVSGRAGAAQLLGLKPSTLSTRMKVLGIQRR